MNTTYHLWTWGAQEVADFKRCGDYERERIFLIIAVQNTLPVKK
jgi:hypothetical protein